MWVFVKINPSSACLCILQHSFCRSYNAACLAHVGLLNFLTKPNMQRRWEMKKIQKEDKMFLSLILIYAFVNEECTTWYLRAWHSPSRSKISCVQLFPLKVSAGTKCDARSKVDRCRSRTLVGCKQTHFLFYIDCRSWVGHKAKEHITTESQNARLKRVIKNHLVQCF